MICGRTEQGVLYAAKRGGSAVGYCALSIRVGTRDEQGWHSGIAHFTEHTIFKGTEHKSASVINSYLDRLGGELKGPAHEFFLGHGAPPEYKSVFAGKIEVWQRDDLKRS